MAFRDLREWISLLSSDQRGDGRFCHVSRDHWVESRSEPAVKRSRRLSIRRGEVDAGSEGIHRYKTDKEFALKVIRKYIRTQDPAVLEVAYSAYEPVIPALPYPSEESFKATLEVLAQENPKAEEIDLKRVLDKSFVQRIETGGFIQRLYR